MLRELTRGAKSSKFEHNENENSVVKTTKDRNKNISFG